MPPCRRDGLRAAGEPTPVEPPVWERQLGGSQQIEDLMSLPPDWQQFPYPFVGSQLDLSLFPVAEWREASRVTLSMPEIGDWAVDAANADDGKLLQEIRSKVLPRRGIHARPDEVLVTAGGQQALHLTVELLVEPGTTVAVEEPGNPELVALLRRRRARLVFQPVDHDGMVVDERLIGCGVVYVSPSHQRPTGVALSPARRAALMAMAAERDFIVVEDDFESEAGDLEAMPPALRAGVGRPARRLRRDAPAVALAGAQARRARRFALAHTHGPGPAAHHDAPSAAVRAADRRAPARARPLRHHHGARRCRVPAAAAGAARCAQSLPRAPDRHPAGAERHRLLGHGPRAARRAAGSRPRPRRAAS